MTVSFRHVPDFNLLPHNQAADIVYNGLVPWCESKGVKLSQYGNLESSQAYLDLPNPQDEYSHRKAAHSLLNIGRIQRAFRFLNIAVTPASRYNIESERLRHCVQQMQDEYLSPGDLIAATLLMGITGRFAKKGEPYAVNCTFKAKWLN